MYLMIQNPGEADVRSFTTLGLSTSRGDNSAIGQFGSGAKHGVLLLLRQGINPYIYCGKTRVEFFTQPNMMGNTEYNSVFCRIGTKTQELSYCLEFGELDWTSTDMALREFISNAIDQSEVIKDVVISVVENPRAKSGFTRVFVPMTPEIQRFYGNIHEKFLQFAGKDSETLLDKKQPSPAKVYRKGVLVRELSSWTKNSLFDYNLGESLPIDESRNLDDYKCQDAIGRALSESEKGIRTIFDMFVHDRLEDCMELRMSQYHLESQDWWKKVWESVAGSKVIIPFESTVGDQLRRKGFDVVRIPTGWYYRMKEAGITIGQNKLNTVENKGCVMVATTEAAKRTLDEVWSWLVDIHLTMDKPKPPVFCYQRPMEGGCSLNGYCEDDKVFINVEDDNNRQTMMEELAHYITGSTDNSRDFQDFAFRIATEMGKLIYC